MSLDNFVWYANVFSRLPLEEDGHLLYWLKWIVAIDTLLASVTEQATKSLWHFNSSSAPSRSEEPRNRAERDAELVCGEKCSLSGQPVFVTGSNDGRFVGYKRVFFLNISGFRSTSGRAEIIIPFHAFIFSFCGAIGRILFHSQSFPLRSIQRLPLDVSDPLPLLLTKSFIFTGFKIKISKANPHITWQRMVQKDISAKNRTLVSTNGAATCRIKITVAWMAEKEF